MNVENLATLVLKILLQPIPTIFIQSLYLCPIIKRQKPMNKVNYVEPEIQVVEVEVEKGFAASGNEGQYTPIPGQPEGGDSF